MDPSSRTPNTVRVMLVDDHAVVRTGYRTLLETSSSLAVVCEASSGEQAQQLYKRHEPDVVVMDISLPGISGIETIKRIVHQFPKARIIVVSMYDDTTFVDQALQAGALGYMAKSGDPAALGRAILTIARGGTYLDASIAQHLAFQKSRGIESPFGRLSTREFEIARLLASGFTIGQIATRLSLGYKTVANYKTQITAKLDVRTTAELTRLCIRYGLLEP